MSKIVNLNYVSDRRSWAKKNGNTYIGRGTRELPPSKWGNPYEVGVGKYKYTRKEAISLYEAYILASETLKSSLGELVGQSLGCWCAPKPCHGEVLSRLAHSVPGTPTVFLSSQRTTMDVPSPTTTVHITEHITTASTVISSASITTSTNTTFSRSSEKMSQPVGPRLRSSTPHGSTVQSSYMKIKVSPGKSEPSEVPVPKPLPIEPSMEDLLGRITTLTSLYTEQNNTINQLERKIQHMEEDIVDLNGKLITMNARLSVRDHVVKGLKGEIQRLQQYTRRYSVTISGIEKKRQENSEELREEVLKLVGDVKSTTNEHDIDKFHRNGRVHNEKNQDIILRFKSHAAKEAFYKARKSLPPARNNIKIRPSLSPSQKNLLHKANKLIEDYDMKEEHNPPEFVFANIHGELQVKLKKKSRHGLFVTFHNIDQLVYIIKEAQAIKEADEEYERVSSWADDDGKVNPASDSEDDMGFSSML